MTVAPSGSINPARKLPVVWEITPTIQGIIAGPTDARENMIAPMLRAATPKRCDSLATVIGYKVEKLSPVMSAPAITPANAGAQSISPMPAIPAAYPNRKTLLSGKWRRNTVPSARPSVSADQKNAGMMDAIAAPCVPNRET